MPLVVCRLTHILPEVLHSHMVYAVVLLFCDVQGDSVLISAASGFPDLQLFIEIPWKKWIYSSKVLLKRVFGMQLLQTCSG